MLNISKKKFIINKFYHRNIDVEKSVIIFGPVIFSDSNISPRRARKMQDISLNSSYSNLLKNILYTFIQCIFIKL